MKIRRLRRHEKSFEWVIPIDEATYNFGIEVWVICDSFHPLTQTQSTPTLRDDCDKEHVQF